MSDKRREEKQWLWRQSSYPVHLPKAPLFAVSHILPYHHFSSLHLCFSALDSIKVNLMFPNFVLKPSLFTHRQPIKFGFPEAIWFSDCFSPFSEFLCSFGWYVIKLNGWENCLYSVLREILSAKWADYRLSDFYFQVNWSKESKSIPQIFISLQFSYLISQCCMRLFYFGELIL